MIKPEEFENGMFLALENNVEALAHFSVGMGERTVRLVKVQGVFWVPLNKQGFLDAAQATAIEQMKETKNPAELIQVASAAGIIWIGGSL